VKEYVGLLVYRRTEKTGGLLPGRGALKLDLHSNGEQMSGSAVIREYAATDEAALMGLVLELQAFERQWDDCVRPPADMGPWYVADLLEQCARDQGTILIAERDGKAVGYAVVYTGLNTTGDRDQIEYRYGRIGDLCVTESCRGSGIGRALIAECEARTRAAGVRFLTIRHDPQNVRPERLYARLGFRTVQIVREKKLD
jgi:ribosomal protein S18 acetylase RimI-like enzyme